MLTSATRSCEHLYASAWDAGSGERFGTVWIHLNARQGFHSGKAADDEEVCPLLDLRGAIGSKDAALSELVVLHEAAQWSLEISNHKPAQGFEDARAENCEALAV